MTAIGRQTGKPPRIEIWFAIDQGAVYLLSGGRDRSDWVRNLPANPNVTIELGPETFSGIAEVLAPDTPSDHRAHELLVREYQQGNDLESWGRTSLPIRITLMSMAE